MLVLVQAAIVVNNFVRFLAQFMRSEGVFMHTGGPRPPTTFHASQEPVHEYNEPHVMALYMRTAMYAKLAGGNATDCDTVIDASLKYFDFIYFPGAGAAPSGCNPFREGVRSPAEPNGALYYGFWPVPRPALCPRPSSCSVSSSLAPLSASVRS